MHLKLAPMQQMVQHADCMAALLALFILVFICRSLFALVIGFCIWWLPPLVHWRVMWRSVLIWRAMISVVNHCTLLVLDDNTANVTVMEVRERDV